MIVLCWILLLIDSFNRVSGQITNGCQRRKSSRHINQIPLVHQNVLRLRSERGNAICLPMLQDPLDPVELGAIGKVGLVGDDKCEREEGGDGSRLFCPSHTFKFKLKCEGCLCCTWRILPPYPIPPGHRMTQASRKGPWLWPPADVSFSMSRTLLLPA